MSKRKKLIVNSSLIFVAIAPIVLYAYEYGPDPGYTAAPGDNATACINSGCHTGTLNSGKGSVAIVASGGTNYVPGQMQTIKVTITDSTERKYGFQLSARVDSSPKTTEAGFLIPGSDGLTQVLCADGSNLDTPTYATGCTAKQGGTLEWIEHTLTGYNKSGTPPSYTYTFTWMPPATNVGTVTLYAAGNAVTGALVVTGTETYATHLQLSPSAGGGTPPTVGAAVSAATNAAGGAVASGSWMSVYGTNLAPAGDSRQITGSDIVNGNLPTTLDGTSATVDGKPAFIGYLSPGQLNIEVPDDPNAAGPVAVVVMTGGGASTAATVNLQKYAPGLFQSGQGNYIAAQHADGSAVGGFTGSTPAKPGETIVLWATGLGPATPAVPAGQLITAAPAAPGNLTGVTVTIGGQPATVVYAGKTISGDDQVNVQVPSGISNGDQSVVLMVGGVSTQANAIIAVHN